MSLLTFFKRIEADAVAIEQGIAKLGLTPAATKLVLQGVAMLVAGNVAGAEALFAAAIAAQFQAVNPGAPLPITTPPVPTPPAAAATAGS